MIDRVDNETKEARLFLSQRNSTENKENATTRERAVHLRAHMSRMVMWSMQINSLSGFELQGFRATRKNISRGGQRFPAVVSMKRIFQLILTCCGSEETAPETVKGLGYWDHAYEEA